jgi:hypothetical protein
MARVLQVGCLHCQAAAAAAAAAGVARAASLFTFVASYLISYQLV